MKPFLIALGLALSLGGGYWYLQRHPERLPVQWQAFVPSASQWPLNVTAQKAPSPKTVERVETKTATPPAPLKNPATLYLANGGIVTGELVDETPDQVVLRWEYGDVGFQRAEIQRIVKGAQDTGKDHVTLPWEGEGAKVRWPYQYPVVVKLMSGTVVDAQLTAVTPDALVLTHALAGGGTAEQTIPRAHVEELLFRPIQNERSAKIEENLRALFPAMHWYQEGLFTIVTDSTPPTVKDYRRTVRELSMDWYLAFFPLARERTPEVQQYLVIFDSWDSYIEYAATDGIPGWMAVGYFNPDDETLYCFNMLGERFSELLYEVYLGQFRQARDQISEQIKGSGYELTIEGQMSEFLKKLETAHATARQLFGQISVDILRHELTHAMFHNWQLQGVVLSQLSEDGKAQVEQKRRFLQSRDVAEKRQLLDALLSSKRSQPLADLRAANSWFIEGLAGYMEPSPVGGPNQLRLADMQEAHRLKHIIPLEFLHTFKMGSFLGMASQSAREAYAQSWALCHFLMQRYPVGFLAYLDRLAREHPQEGEDTLPWLMQALDREQRPLEQEFLAHVEQFPPEDPLWLKQVQSFLDLRAELSALASRFWGG